VSASGSYTYDDNNNLLTTKSLSVYRTALAYLAVRAAWTFTYDRKNRLQSYTNAGAGNDVGNIWYDGRGRVWQRWVYLAGSEWDSNVTRYVYDGSAYAQEHNFTVANVSNAWVYTYDQILTDYLRKPGGVRQRDISTVDQSETDQFLLSDSGSVSARIQRETNSLVQRIELTASGTAQAAGSQQDTTISKLGLRGGYTETFSGSTEFDPLVQLGGRHYLAGLGREVNTRYNDGDSNISGVGAGGDLKNPQSPKVPASPPGDDGGAQSLGGNLPPDSSKYDDTQPINPSSIRLEVDETKESSCDGDWWTLPALTNYTGDGEWQDFPPALVVQREYQEQCCGTDPRYRNKTTFYSNTPCTVPVYGYWFHCKILLCTVVCKCTGNCLEEQWVFQRMCPFEYSWTGGDYLSRKLTCSGSTCNDNVIYNSIIYDTLDFWGKISFRTACGENIKTNQNAQSCRIGCPAFKTSGTEDCWTRPCPKKGA
jgi:hypothetical protein